MACDGACTFWSEVAYLVDGRGVVAGFRWSAGHSATGDCTADIGLGVGHFRFKRVFDAQEVNITRAMLDHALNTGKVQPDPAPSVSTVTEGGLPQGMSVRRLGDSYTGIDVRLIPGLEAQDMFMTVDLSFALGTTCVCAKFASRKELYIRFAYDASSKDENPITHNGDDPADTVVSGGTENTLRWVIEDNCAESRTELRHFTRVGELEMLRKVHKSEDDGMDKELRRRLRELEEEEERLDHEMPHIPLSMAGYKLWDDARQASLEDALGKLESFRRTGKLKSSEYLKRLRRILVKGR